MVSGKSCDTNANQEMCFAEKDLRVVMDYEMKIRQHFLQYCKEIGSLFDHTSRKATQTF